MSRLKLTDSDGLWAERNPGWRKGRKEDILEEFFNELKRYYAIKNTFNSNHTFSLVFEPVHW